ncbi:hypothetical protein [Methanoculleus sp.]|uniref:hypothetical protein n=1 Tax=Methanoculleus sp. TaxID=90427 RepID=UPI00261AA65E|nr:hypothetical protein [Methanoculleus sp.]MDI6866426.1 hypothetical protein [Methanoculleus sp.]
MDSATREKARNVLKRILAAASYDVEEVGDPLDLSAVGSEDALVVLCSDDPETIESFDFMTYRLRIGEEDWVCRKLLFTMNPEVLTEDCIRWGPDEFVQQAGRAALAEVLGQRLLLDIQRPELDLPERRVEAAPPMEEGLERGPELPHLPVRVTEKRACEIAGVKGTVKCRLIPYWRYTYVSSGEREVKGRLVSFDSEGSGAINAINGLKMEINLDDIERDSTPPDSEIVPPRLMREDVEEEILREVTEMLTQRIRFRYEKGDTIFYEEKTLKPDRNSIRIELETIYVPVWQIRGGSKIVEVNAFSGEILSTPMDEGVELL